MTRVSVLSDTHDRLPLALVAALADGADEIWHLGDVCEPSALTPLEALGVPLRVVRGNCDWNAQWPKELRFELHGWRVLLTHIPPLRPPAATDLVLHGHTHVPRHERIAGVVFLNPGPIMRPGRGAAPGWARLTLAPGTYLWEPQDARP